MPVEDRVTQVLVIQARNDKDVIDREQANLKRIAQGTETEFTFVNPLKDEHISWEDPNEILLQYGSSIWLGSYDVDLSQASKDQETYLRRTQGLAKAILANDVPTIGICLGHQTLAKAAGSEVRKLEGRNESGPTELMLTSEGKADPAFAGLQGRGPIIMVFGHKESIQDVPEGFTRLGYTKRDPNSALRRGRILTLQGHPEITDIAELRKRLSLANETPDHKPYEVTYEFTLHPSHTDQIIRNFLTALRLED